MKCNKITVLGISAGQGALLFPFYQCKSRFKVIGNIEPRGVFHTPEDEQWKLNFKNTPFLRESKPFIDTLGRCDIVVSSPDCGASSIMRLSKVKKLGKPSDNKSLNLVLESIKYILPSYFLIENLPRLLNLMPDNFFEDYFSEYDLIYHTRSVSDYGNSQQSRKRLVVIGIKKELSKKSSKILNKVFKVNKLKVTRDLLEDANFNNKIHNYSNNNFMLPKDKVLAMYDYRKLPDKKNLTVDQIHYLWNHDFKNEKKWPIKSKKMNTLPGVYRLELDKKPLTLRPADRQFRPDGWPLGIRDFKNIMGLPEKYKIYMDLNRYLYWINKARYTIAKGSVYEVGLWFKKRLVKIYNKKV